MVTAPLQGARRRLGPDADRPVVLVSEARGFSPAVAARLDGIADVRLEDLDRDGLLRAVGEADVLWVRLRHYIDTEVIDAGKRLRAIVSATTGTDHIDVGAAERRGVQVLSLRDSTGALGDVRATAEHTVGLILALLRRLPAAVEHVRGGDWNRDLFWGHEIFGKTVGVVGYGRLGRIVARYLRAFDAEVVVADPHLSPADAKNDGVRLAPLDALLAESHIVTLHASVTEATRGLIGRRELGLMPRGSWLVNTARGALVDEEALLKALGEGRLAGAALDVVAGEHTGRSRPVLDYARTHDNLIVTPHIGGATVESREKTEAVMADRLLEFLGAQAGDDGA